MPKRIITRDNNKINSSFKTNPQGAKLNSDVQYIDNEKKVHNVSEYRSNRVFQNETLAKNQIYYYGNKENSETLASNKNVIFKGNY